MQTASVAPTVLITLGRLPKALDLARSFKSLGWRVIIAEPFRWHLAGISNSVTRSYQVTAPLVSRARYLTELLDIIRAESVELVVPISEEIVNVSFIRAQLPAGVTLYSMTTEILLALHDKHSFIARCQRHGLDAPATAVLGDAASTALAQAHDYIVKPIYSCSGRGVLFKQQGEPLPLASSQQPAIVQRWVKGNVLSTFSIAREGAAMVTVVYRGAVMSGTVAVCFERVSDDDAEYAPVMEWVRKFIAAERFNGFISFDLVVDAQGRAQGIECNPRATSGLHFVDQRDLANAVIAAESSVLIRFRCETLLQQFYPCLTAVQKSMFGEGNFRRNLSRLLAARDVTWRWRDPLPFLSMPLTASQIIWMAIRKNTTFGEVATLDVGWYEDGGGGAPATTSALAGD